MNKKTLGILVALLAALVAFLDQDAEGFLVHEGVPQ